MFGADDQIDVTKRRYAKVIINIFFVLDLNFKRNDIGLTKMSLKSELTCSYCMKIYRKPVILPCNDCLCEEHLKDKDVLKVKSIQCKTCNQEFSLDENEFKPNKIVQSLIEKEMHLTEAEKAIKKLSENFFNEGLRLNEELENNKRMFSLKCFEYFQEIRRKIDLQRDQLKDEIDKIALSMIDQTKEFEVFFMKRLEPNEEKASKLTADLKKLVSETYRDPEALLKLETTPIENVQSKTNKELDAIKARLKEFDEMRNHFLAANSFQPNLTFDKDSFGFLNLVDYFSLNESRILSIKQEYLDDLIKLCEFPSNAKKWSLLYRGTKDGFNARDFHKKCDGKYSTLTIIKAKSSSYIFGGYSEAEWQSFGGDKYDPNAFIFSLTNKDNKPCKINVSDPNKAIYCSSSYGPIFGGSYLEKEIKWISGDIRVTDNGNLNTDNVSNLGDAYKHPSYLLGSKEANSFLAGTQNFQIEEIEVYQSNLIILRLN